MAAAPQPDVSSDGARPMAPARGTSSSASKTSTAGFFANSDSEESEGEEQEGE